MREEKLRAIVLRTLPFKDKQAILTLLSEEKGLISMIVKGIAPSRPQLTACTSPLCEAEFIYRQGSSDLLLCKDVSLLDPHLGLRKKYHFIELGSQFCKIILDTQLPGKPTQALYALVSSFLKQIPHFPEALHHLKGAFLLKVLKHEGMLSTTLTCSICDRPQAFHIHGSHHFCSIHAPPCALHFSLEEWDIICQLAYVSSFTKLRHMTFPSSLLAKIESHFQQSINMN
jgi:DNA repair protein RecO (recombination protein O)